MCYFVEYDDQRAIRQCAPRCKSCNSSDDEDSLGRLLRKCPVAGREEASGESRLDMGMVLPVWLE